MADRDDLIRERAYQMWKEQGCPDGLAADHWYAAEQELVEAEEAEAANKETSKEPAKKK
jgi:hypothetical protein